MKEKLSAEDVQQLAIAWGLLLVNWTVYGPKHNVTVQSRDEAHGVLTRAVERAGAVHIVAHGKRLLVNGAPVDLTPASAAMSKIATFAPASANRFRST